MRLLKNYASAYAYLAGQMAELEGRVLHHATLSQEKALAAEHTLVAAARNLMGGAARAADELQLQATKDFLARHKDDFARAGGGATMTGGAVLITTMQQTIKELRGTLDDELKRRNFLAVSEEEGALYENKEPFTAAVAAKFPAMSEDIQCAAQCLALGQNTASVFHLMRVMEQALHVLGRKLKVQFDPAKQPWFDICNLAVKAATNRAAKTAAQRAKNAALGAAAAHLQTVRLAWRNEVMHPKQTYTPEQAREVFDATRALVRHLADLV